MPKGRRPAAIQAPPGSPLNCGWVPTFLRRPLPPRRAPGLPCPAYSPPTCSRTSPRHKTARTAAGLLLHERESVCSIVLRARTGPLRVSPSIVTSQFVTRLLRPFVVSPYFPSSSHRAPLFFFSFLGRPDLNVITIVAQRAFTLRHAQ